jgi:hypothetical protein
MTDTPTNFTTEPGGPWPIQRTAVSFWDRSTWGICPSCSAGPGQPCRPTPNTIWALTHLGAPAMEVHAPRLEAAPLFRVLSYE